MAEPKCYYITTPIYYVNDSPHIGHAYTTLACDVLARFKRLDGWDVKFLTGTDEHGQKVENSARAAGVDPQDFTDRVSQNFRDLAEFMNFSHDDFIRTTEPRHHAAVHDLWRRLKDSGFIYLGCYAGWYAVRDEAFYGEGELVDGPNSKKVAPTGADIEWVEEPSYFFKLSAMQDRLLAFYDKNPDFIAPQSRRNEVKSFVSGGLRDLSISRTTFKWGVPVPDDEDHIMYVWLDALTNYMTGVGYPETETGEYTKYWPADLQMVGKDILRFHAVYWPAFLMAADLPLPKRVFAHGWWTNEGEKISKSLGNVIDPRDLVDKYGLDQVRFFLLREVPFGNDGDFSHAAIISRINSELSNDFGNLAQRVLSMVAKNCDGKVPSPGEFNAEDQEMLGATLNAADALRDNLDKQLFHNALDALWAVIRQANVYVDHQAPWKLRKENPPRMETVLYVLVECIRRLALLNQPFMPDTMAKMLNQLAIPMHQRTINIHVSDKYRLTAGQKLPKPEGLFPRFLVEND